MGGQEAHIGDSTTYLLRYVRQYVFYMYHTHGGLPGRPCVYADTTGDSALTTGGLERRDILCQRMVVAHASCVDDGRMYLSKYVCQYVSTLTVGCLDAHACTQTIRGTPPTPWPARKPMRSVE